MRLLELLAAVDDETIERVGTAYLTPSERESRPAACANLETVVRSPKHVRDTVFNLRPPSFAILSAAIDAEGHQVPLAGLRGWAMAETLALAEVVTTRQIVSRDDGLRLYRRVLTEARRNDLELDPSETALLAVLRQELSIRQVEHFLIEHHADLHPYWNTEHAFLDMLSDLRSSGIAYIVDGALALPDELVPIIRKTMGLEASRAACRRLFERVVGNALSETLAMIGAKSSGTKEEKIQRLVDNYVQPSDLLVNLGIGDIKDLCRDLSLPVSGAKEDLIAQVAAHFATSGDLRPPSAAPPPPPAEPRTLAPDAFDSLFSCLRGQDLSDILVGIGSARVTGAKEHLVRLIRDSRFNEVTLLMELDGRQLESALARMHMNKGGAKRDRAERLVQFFAGGGSAEPPPSTAFQPELLTTLTSGSDEVVS